MTQHDAELETGLVARMIRLPKRLLLRDELTKRGDSHRYQIGEIIPNKVLVEKETAPGEWIVEEVDAPIFKLIAFGSSYAQAVSRCLAITKAK